MPLPDVEFRRYRDAYLRHDTHTLLGTGDALATRLAGQAWSRHLVPAVILMQGSTKATHPRLAPPAEAIRYLAQGLDLYRQVHGDAATPSPEARDLDLEFGPVQPFSVQLIGLYLIVGRYGDAMPLVQRCEEPTNDTVTRLAGLRAHAAAATVQGSYELAHQVLNTASSLAERMRSRFAAMLVDADRAVVLGTQGRLGEGISLFDHLQAKMARPGHGTSGAWAAAATAAVALSLSRFAAEAGDPIAAERILYPGAAAVDQLDDPYWDAQLDLSISTLLWSQRRFDDAVELCRRSRTAFEAGGYLPGTAQAIMHEGRLAWSQGFGSVAAPLLELARSQLIALGHHREPAQIDQALTLLAAAPQT